MKDGSRSKRSNIIFIDDIMIVKPYKKEKDDKWYCPNCDRELGSMDMFCKCGAFMSYVRR